MTIVALEPHPLPPREELVTDIMLMLDEAITNDEPIGVYDLAERILSLVEDQQLIV